MNEIRLSPSRLSDYERCPQSYKFRVIDQIPEAISLDAERGTLVHSVLEELHSLERSDRNLSKAKSLAPKFWEVQKEANPELLNLIPDEKEWLDRVHALLENYFHLEDPTIFDSSHRELYLTHSPSEQFLFHGYVDRLDIAKTGEVRIVDYKTGKIPPVAFQDKSLFQLRFYAAIWWRNNGTVPKLLQLLFLGDRQTLKDNPTESDLITAEKTALRIGQGILNSIKDDIWPTKTSKLCNWCSFKSICPAFTE